jgi:hypothetical protein
MPKTNQGKNIHYNLQIYIYCNLNIYVHPRFCMHEHFDIITNPNINVKVPKFFNIHFKKL